MAGVVEIRSDSAIVGLNVDRDGRALPQKAVAGDDVGLDHTRPVRPGDDDELLLFRVYVEAEALATYERLALRVSGDADVVVLDQYRRTLNPSGGAAFEYPLPAEAGTHRYYLEAASVKGIGAFTLTAFGINGDDATPLHAKAFRVAPLLLLGDDAPVTALYMSRCPDNHPAVKDVETAVKSLRIVEEKDNATDAWMQDQFQMAAVITPRRAMPVVLHMPRMGKNAAINTGVFNLSRVVRAHFPSTNLGLIQDLWDRTVEVQQPGGGMLLVPFQDSLRIYRAFKSIDMTERHVAGLVRRLRDLLGRKHKPEMPPPASIVYLLDQLPLLVGKLDGLEKAVRGKFPQGDLDEMMKLARDKVLDVQTHVTHAKGVLTLKWTGGPTYTMTDAAAWELAQRLELMHDSTNFGGNVEVSPASPGAPFGKIFIGTELRRKMDPEVRALIGGKDALQPVVEIDTSWLAVAHIDELISFVPGRSAGGKPVVFRASPEVARRLMIVAASLYSSDGWVEHWQDWDPKFEIRHDMNKGAHPVTRMFRGRMWLHEHPARESQWGEGGDSIAGADPPNIYLHMHDWHAAAGGVSPVRYHYGSRLRRDYYAAKMTIYECMYFDMCRASTRLKNHFLELDTILDNELPGFPIRRVPVVFDDELLPRDECAATQEGPGTGAITAFTPNLVNLQVAGDKVLIPRPFGPRMRPGDAARVIRSVLREEKLDGIANMVDEKWLAAKPYQLDQLHIWMNQQQDGKGYEQSIRTIRQIADEFADSFPGGTSAEARQQAIRDANPGVFLPRARHPEEKDPDLSDELRPGWTKLHIPGASVDLFEAYTHALLVAQGCTPVWVDAWYYHVRHGEIHCGTNALRKVPDAWPKWWT